MLIKGDFCRSIAGSCAPSTFGRNPGSSVGINHEKCIVLCEQIRRLCFVEFVENDNGEEETLDIICAVVYTVGERRKVTRCEGKDKVRTHGQ